MPGCCSPAPCSGPAATEAIHLTLRHAFDDLGYRRFEWKCDSLNEPSRRAARRLGFAYEGRFRQHMVTKGRNRDTDWFSVTDREWPAVRAAHQAWLDPGNFDAAGQQRVPLSSLTGPLRAPWNLPPGPRTGRDTPTRGEARGRKPGTERGTSRGATAAMGIRLTAIFDSMLSNMTRCCP